MPNLYGVANTPPQLQGQGTIGGSTVTCPAATETNVFASTTIAAFDHGIYYPVAWGQILVTFGATQSTNLTFAIRVNSGSDIAILQCNIPAGSSSNSVNFPFSFCGSPLATAFWPPGSIVQVSLLAGGFGVTVAPGYSVCTIGILRAPDQ